MSGDAALQTKLRKRLEALLKLPENGVCCDCRRRGPRWASANLGVFMCIECSGIHRNLGVHISFVRSVNLDSWTKTQVDFMEEWGNGRANEYFEAGLPAHYVRPKESDSVRVVERFIRDKYELKKFLARSIPPKVVREEEEEEEEEVVRRRPSRKSNSSSTAAAAPAASTQRVSLVAAKPTVTEPVNLLDFDASPSPAPVPTAAPPVPVASSNNFLASFDAPPPPPPPDQQQQQQQFNNFGADFSSFGGQPAPQNTFVDFGAPASAPTQSSPFGAMPTSAPPPVPEARPKIAADAILSLYGNGMNNPYGGMGAMSGMGPAPGNPQLQMGGMGGMGGMGMNMMGGMPMGGLAPMVSGYGQPAPQGLPYGQPVMGNPYPAMGMQPQPGYGGQFGGQPTMMPQQLGGMGGYGGMPGAMSGAVPNAPMGGYGAQANAMQGGYYPQQQPQQQQQRSAQQYNFPGGF